MAVANVARGVLLGVMAALVGLREVDYALLVGFVLANAGIRAVYYSASQAAMTELVDATGFNRANGVLYGTEAATENLAGPTLGTMAFAVVRAVPLPPTPSPCSYRGSPSSGCVPASGSGT